MDSFPLALACVFLLLAPAASAGTAANPEVTDPAGDAGPLGQLDITGAYVDAGTRDNVTFHVLAPNLTAAPHDAGACSGGMSCVALTLAFRLEFAVLAPDGAAPALPEYGGTVVVFRQDAPEGIRATIGYRDTNGTLHVEGAVKGRLGAGEAILTVPRSDPAMRIPAGPTPGGYRIVGLVVSSAPELCLPPVPHQPPEVTAEACTDVPKPEPASVTPQAGQEARWDVAPDAGTGREFVFAVPPDPAPAVAQAPAAENATPASAGTATHAPAPAATPSIPSAPPAQSPTPASPSASPPSPPSPLPAATSTANKRSPAPEVGLALACVLGLVAARRRLSA